jgi:hypothetical protein
MMMMEETEHLAYLLNKDLGEETGGLVFSPGQIDRSIIREQLAHVIARLMQENFERLCQAMYRLDVSEKKFHEAMTELPVEQVPLAIADLVIEREMQKVRTRMMYKRKEL